MHSTRQDRRNNTGNVSEYRRICRCEKTRQPLEMINMEEKCEGVIAQLKKESKKEGKAEGEKNIIKSLTETFTVDAIAQFTHKEKSEILEILNSS